MKVPLLDLSPQLDPIRAEITAAISEVVDSMRYIMGPKVTELETNIAEYCGASHGVAVSSGTDALLVSLMALDIGPEDIVISTPYSFFATMGTVARLGATPVFVDIDPKDYNMDPRQLAAWFESNPEARSRVKAIIPVHLYGQCADMDPILEIADRFGVPVIEDGAQAIGATYPSKTGVRGAGTMGVTGCLSFFPSKNLGAMGDGGMVLTNDDAMAEKLRKLRGHGASPKYYHALVGGNFRLDAMQAAILSVKLPHLDKWHAARRENAAYYDAHLHSQSVRKPALTYGREHHIYNQYVIAVDGDRDAVRTALSEAGVATEIYYPVPFHLQECFAYLNYSAGDFPVSEWAAKHSLALPVYPGLSREQQDHVIESVCKACDKHAAEPAES